MTEEVISIVEFSEDIGEQNPPEPLPVRDYPAQIVSAEVKTSARDTKYAAVGFFINVDDYPADYSVDNGPDGKTIIFRRVGMEDNNQSRYGLKRFLEAIGAPMSTRIDCNDWVGLDATVSVEHDTWEGVTREQIVRVSAA